MGMGHGARCMALAWLALAAPARAGDDTVTTTAGAVRGSAGAYLDIPYAAPPVGALRWRAPQAAAKWEGTRDATRFGNDCLQNRMGWDKAMSAQPTSEDCLYLNVWTPRADASARLPVLVWIHGGGFASGSGSSPLTLGDRLAARGAVVVTFNYRLGRFGFFAHPALGADGGNLGLMDQVAALQWVKANIAAFGGDPSNVTLAGQSAGGDSVQQLMLSDAARGLFAKAIVQSGGGRARLPDHAAAQALGVAFARGAGLDDQATAGQLRALAPEKILGGISLLEREKQTWSGPMIDGRVVSTEVLAGFEAGREAKVPLLIGATSDELGAIPEFFLKPITAELLPRLGTGLDAVVKAYGSREAFDRHFASDFNFVEPARKVAALAAHNGHPAYLYRFDYVGEAKRGEWKGAPHASDVAYLFDHLEATGEPVSEADRKQAQALGALWLSFARSGVPQPEGGAAWKPYTTADDKAYVIGAGGIVQASAGNPALDAIGAQLASPAAAAPPATPAANACETLKDFKLAGGTIQGTSNVAPPDTIDIGLKGVPPLPVQGAYCRVQATLTPTESSDIRIEVWLPPKESWNGKFIGAGNAGFAGDFASPYLFMGGAIARGFAAAGTDTGHRGQGMGEGSDAGAAWAMGQPEKLKDYGHRANHVTAIAAKSLIQAYYGKPTKRSYFQGCSNGGREALQEAQRYPSDYDGIIAGAPATPWSKLIAGFAWNARAVQATPEGMPDAKLALVQDAVIEQCDAIDGAKDGLLEDPRRCNFDPGKLQCAAGDGPACLTAGQVELVRKIRSGPVDSKKKKMFPGFPAGAEGVQWGEWITAPASKHAFFATEFLRYMALEDPAWELATMDFEKDLAMGRTRAGPVLDADNADLSPFAKRGGKLILWHGWADAALTPLATIDYYERVRARLGPKRTGDSVRLYLAPGMAHCLGGPGPNDFDMLTKLEAWVEEGKAPQEVLASKYAVDYARLLGFPPGDPLRTRPLCPYPKVAKWDGKGSLDEAASFRCANP